jgi:Ras-related protein Rab-1A
MSLANGVLLLYDIADKASYNNLSSWVEELNRFVSDDVPKVLVGSKSDLETVRAVKYQEAKVLKVL